MPEDQYIRPRKWGEYQAVRKRGAEYIRNQIDLINSRKYRSLTPNQRAVLHGVWLLCGDTARALPLDSSFIGDRLGLTSQVTGHALKGLLACNYLEICSKYDKLVHDAPLKGEGERERKRKNPPIVPPEGGKQKRASQKFVLKEDWQPSEKVVADLQEQGHSDEKIRRCRDDFVDWCIATGTGYVKHDLAFRKWVRNARERRSGNGTAPAGHGSQQHAGGVVSLFGAGLEFERDARRGTQDRGGPDGSDT